MDAQSEQFRVAIVLGSARPHRIGEGVARWVLEQAQRRDDAEYVLVDVAQQNLPLLDEPLPPSLGRYQRPHTKAWAAIVGSFDAFVFVTPEYNHGIAASLKNAIDYLYAEWNDKAAGFVGYGNAGGARAVEQLRLVMAELQVATVRTQVMLSLHNDFENYTVFRPAAYHATILATLFQQVVAWGGALRDLRLRRAAAMQAAAEDLGPRQSSCVS
jgi:NAD(P)H-dependent FMN reductase